MEKHLATIASRKKQEESEQIAKCQQMIFSQPSSCSRKEDLDSLDTDEKKNKRQKKPHCCQKRRSTMMDDWVDMIGDFDDVHLQLVDSDVSKPRGLVGDIEKFYANFFEVRHMQANTIDLECRTTLEEVFMAVMNAGINPNSIRSSRTGVYIASCFSEFEKKVVTDPSSRSTFAIAGCSRVMSANRISYSFGLKEPPLYLGTVYSSPMYGIDVAYGVRREIEVAIVGGTNPILHPHTSLQLTRLGVLSPTDACSPFEGVAKIYLQYRRDACRIYGTLVHCKGNCNGCKGEGKTYPSSNVQEKLLREFYHDLNVSAEDFRYLEAHIGETVIGDLEECRPVYNALWSQRSEPLLTRSLKSNVSLTELAARICSVVKIMFTFQIEKMINLSEPKKEIAALQEDRLEVVSEITELKKPYVGLNCFRFGDANTHILLKQHDKKKAPGGLLEGSLARLYLWSGRTQEAVEKVFKKLESKPLDPEYVSLFHNVQVGGIPGMIFRGYNVLNGTGAQMPTCYRKDIQYYTGVKRPIVWVFGGMGTQWPGMGSALMAIPQFKQSIQQCCNALKPAGVDLMKILTLNDPKMFDNIMHSFVGIAAIQIALVDVLKSCGMEPDYIIGLSTGELGCAYADGCFTVEQTILAAYNRGKVILEKEQIKGSMAAVALSYKGIRGMLPESIEVACHTGPKFCTISGPEKEIEKFVTQLKTQNIFFKEVPCSNIAYHTRYISHLSADYLKYLNYIVPNPKKRSKKWLSTSVPQEHWSRTEALLSSAEYHTNSLLSSVLFEETSALLPENALTIEIAPRGQLQSVLKSAIPNGTHMGLTQINFKDNHIFFLEALGKLYLNGINMSVEALYPKVE